MTTQAQFHAAPKWLLLACATLLDGLFTATAETASGVSSMAPLEECVLRVGFPRVAFANVNENDATAAYRAFIAALGRKRGYDVRAEVMIFDSLRTFEDAVRAGTVHIMIMTTWELLQTKLQDQVDLEFVPVSAGATHRRMLLLARADGPVRQLADVSGRSVLVLRDSHTTMGDVWLRTALRDEIGGAAEAALANAESVARPHAAVLPVFFGRADACVVDDQTFETTAELNPQLRKELVTIARSEPLVETVIALNRRGWLSDRHREDLRQGLAELHLEPSGRQFLTVFRIDGLATYRPAYIESVAALYNRGCDLELRAQASRPPATAP